MPRGAVAVDLEGATEALLVARLARGEPAALDEAYRLHHVALRAFARRFIGDAEAAEDLVHDVFLALPDAVRRFRGEAKLRTFVTAIAVKRAYKFVRSASRRRAAMARLAAQPEASAPPRPDALLAQHELAAVLYRALDQLSPDHRTVFVLCELDELTAGEAAKLVDAPEATVRTRLFHARKKLRALLEEVPR